MQRFWYSLIMEKKTCIGSPEVLLPEMLAYLSRGEGFWLVVTGSSMSPTLLHESDSVYIEPLTGELILGDITLVLAGECHCILHRVIRVSKDVFIMQGDALMNTEGPVPKHCIIGIATLRRRRGKIRRLSRCRSFTITFHRFLSKVKGRIRQIFRRMRV